jgi:hypothetical protein
MMAFRRFKEHYTIRSVLLILILFTIISFSMFDDAQAETIFRCDYNDVTLGDNRLHRL